VDLVNVPGAWAGAVTLPPGRLNPGEPRIGAMAAVWDIPRFPSAPTLLQGALARWFAVLCLCLQR
jgi:hypothetical protein